MKIVYSRSLTHRLLCIRAVWTETRVRRDAIFARRVFHTTLCFTNEILTNCFPIRDLRPLDYTLSLSLWCIVASKNIPTIFFIAIYILYTYNIYLGIYYSFFNISVIFKNINSIKENVKRVCANSVR